MPGDRAEAKFLLASVQRLWDSNKAGEIEMLLQQPIDWEDILEQALFHGMIPVLAYGLSGFWEAIPSKTREKLGTWNAQIATHNLVLTKELVHLLEQFRQLGMPALPLKGPFLAASLYGSVLLRQYQDIDILVRNEHLERARNLLLSSGYVDLDGADRMADDCELHLYNSSRQISVELHWRILPLQRFDSEFLWSRTTVSSIGDFQTIALPADELFLVLALHGGDKHDWASLKWICDLAVLMMKSPIDWERLLAVARVCGAQRCVLRAVSTVHQVFGIALPGPLKGQCSKRNYRGYSSLIRGRLFHSNAGLPGFREWRYYFIGGSNDKGGNRSENYGYLLEYVRAVLEPRFNDRYALRLPPALSFIYYFLRPLSLLRKHGWKLTKRLF